MCAQPVPDWMRPPPEGFTAEDLDRLPDLPPHSELIHGSLILVSAQKGFHGEFIHFGKLNLQRQAPSEFRVWQEMSVILGPTQRPEPDLAVTRADAVTESWRELTSLPGAALELVVEIVSPESAGRDRKLKPRIYAEAEIPHFWLVEDQSGTTVVYVYQLDPMAKTYALTGIHHDRLKLALPFDIDLDLASFDQQ